MFVLLASALKLLNVPTDTLGVILFLVVLIGPDLGAVDGAAHPQHLWDAAGLRRRTSTRWQVFGAVPGRFPVSAVYFATARPKLVAATLLMTDEARRTPPAAAVSHPRGGVRRFERSIAVDGSPKSEKTILIALDMAEPVRLGRHGRSRARVRAIRRAPTWISVPRSRRRSSSTRSSYGSGTRASRRTARSAACSPDNTPEQIVEVAVLAEADLIVLGSQGMSEWKSLVLGGVANKVVHHATCPVLLVR